jgi:stage II sporulation protein R
MKNKSMGLRIARGGVIGIFIGVVAGIVIPTAMHWKNIVENKEKIAEVIGNKVIETFSYVDLYDEIAGEAYGGGSDNADAVCSSLEDVILRFHVRANSNSDEDIALKLAVRDAVLMDMGEKLGSFGEGLQSEMVSAGLSGRDEVLAYLEGNLDEIEKIAKNVITNNGYDYEVNAYISEDYFPIRQYGELTLPAGEYTALRIDIGKAAGENFWCLLYPTMCYTVDSEAFVSKEGEGRLRQELTEEDYDRLFVKKDLEKGQLNVKFKVLEWLGL